jgi:hypothetical protein
MDYIFDNTIRVYENGKERILKLLDSGYKQEAIILSVTICEVLLKDFCRICKGVWIHHKYGLFIKGLNNKETHKFKMKIRDYLISIGAYDNFLKSYYIYQDTSLDPDVDALHEVLFEKIERINFQNLNDKRGARNAYKFFFDIDLKENLNSDRVVSFEKWDQLAKLIQERHNIIHAGSESTMIPDEIRDVIFSLDYLKEFLVNKIGSYYYSNK